MEVYKIHGRHAFADIVEDHHYFRIWDYYVITLFMMKLFMITLRYFITFMGDTDNHRTWEVIEIDSDAEYDFDEDFDESDFEEYDFDEEYESDSISIDFIR